MSEQVDRYLRYLDVERGYAANTLVTYGRVLQEFLQHVARTAKRLRLLKKADVGAYVRVLREQRGNAAKTVRLKLQAIKGFLVYLTEQSRELRRNPLGTRDFRYKVEHKEVESLSEHQLGALLDAVQAEGRNVQKNLERAAGKKALWQKRLYGCTRDLCLFTLLASTGLRIAEALNITLADIDLLDKSIRIVGKGKKIRRVFFDLEQVERTLLSYLGLRQALKLEHEYMFVSTKAYRPLGCRGAQKLLKSYLAKAGLRTTVTPHILRHSFATIAIEKGANIKAVSQILGHANCSITIDLYTHLSSEHLRQVMQKCNPLSTIDIPLEERIEGRKKHLVYLEKTG